MRLLARLILAALCFVPLCARADTLTTFNIVNEPGPPAIFGDLVIDTL